jgi:aspergillopepsin I
VHPELRRRAESQAGELRRRRRDLVTGIATPDKDNWAYGVPVEVGGVTMMVEFDTGSTNLWALSSLTNKNSLGGRPGEGLYDPSRSGVAQLLNKTFDYGYGGGGIGVQGHLYTDDVSVGPLVSHDFTVGAVVNATESIATGAMFAGVDALMGFYGETDWFATIAKDLPEPYFVADLKQNAPGAWTFGGMPDGYEESEVSWLSRQGGWTIQVDGWSVAGKEMDNSTAIHPIVDSGTPFILMSPDRAGAFYSGTNSSYTPGVGFVYRCDDTLPELRFHIGAYDAILLPEILKGYRVDDQCKFFFIHSNILVASSCQ